ncbi:phytanoyl-CoA dioxygenase [Apiospora phragmitis]|uniref:Phytanoyl-CoA dioxygenase n=1 Tax=Apiospora phragmitis TaxID=2905665 RepID=A0ABR1VC37_9PEZI
MRIRDPTQPFELTEYPSDEYFSYTGETLVPQKSGYMLASTAALRLVPGAKRQPLHRDQIAYQIRPDPNNPLFTPMVGCLVAGSKCTFKNGATAVIPGSHMVATHESTKIEECTYAEMEPGSALFTLGIRGSVHPLEVARKLPDDILRLAGYSDAETPPNSDKSVGGIGYVEDHQHPVEYLKKDKFSAGGFNAEAQAAI